MAAGNNLFLEEKPKVRSAVVSEPFLPSTISNSKANNSETDQIKLQYTDILQQKYYQRSYSPLYINLTILMFIIIVILYI
jgi:hypothetical protein